MTKRLLHIVDSLEPGDVGQQLLLLARGLPRDAMQMHVCALGRGPLAQTLARAGCEVFVVPRRLPADPWTVLRLAQHMARVRPHLVQTWQFTANSYGRIAARRAGIEPVVAVERSLDCWKRWPEWSLDRKLARQTACIVAASSHVQEFYHAQGVHPARYEVIPDGIQPQASNEMLRENLLDDLGLPSTSRLVGAWAPLHAASRMKNLVWALDVLRWLHADLHLLILGDGPQRNRLLRYIDCVEVPQFAHWLGAREDASEIVANLDVFWHPAAQDGASHALLHAMASGVPVVALDTPVHRGLIRPGETGFLAEAHERPSFARWTHRLLEDPALRERVASAGAAVVREDYSVERFLDSYRKLYSELL